MHYAHVIPALRGRGAVLVDAADRFLRDLYAQRGEVRHRIGSPNWRIRPPLAPVSRYVVIAQHTHPAGDPVCYRPDPGRVTQAYRCIPEIIGTTIGHTHDQAVQVAYMSPQFRSEWYRGLSLVHVSMARPDEIKAAEAKDQAWRDMCRAESDDFVEGDE